MIDRKRTPPEIEALRKELKGLIKKTRRDDRREYNRRYQKENRFLITGPIRGSKEECRLLKEAYSRAGISWLRVLFRGLGIKRPGDP